MNTYKKKFLTLGIAFIITPQIHTAIELDAAGKSVLIELTVLHNQLIKTSRLSPQELKFDFTEWNFLLTTNVKSYIEDKSKLLGIKDDDLIHYLNLLLYGNDNLVTTIRKVQAYKKPARPLNKVDIHLFEENLLKPFERIEQNVKNIIMPRIEKLTFYTNNKKLAQAMLIHVFKLIQ